ncbi:MAG: hypothetical protein GY827_11445 [Cytophagales bacterium]|nr:hypothetical protein [Cytophagales bacterium]
MSEDRNFLLFNEVKNNLRQLIQNYQSLQERLVEVETENELLQEEVVKKNEQIKELKNQRKINKIVSNVALEEHDVEELKARLERYIKEIDKCINTLNNHEEEE